MDEVQRPKPAFIIGDSANIYSAIRYYLDDMNIPQDKIDAIVSYMIAHTLQDLGIPVQLPQYTKEGDSLKELLLSEIPSLLEIFRKLNADNVSNVEVNIDYAGCYVHVS